MAPFVSEDTEDSGIFGEEEGAVGEDADLVFGGGEEPGPCLAWDGPAVRIDGSQLLRACPGD